MQPQHLELARGQLAERGRQRRLERAGGRRTNSSISRRVIDGASSASPAATTWIAVDELLRRGVLEQEAARAGAQRLVDVLVEVERGQHQHPRSVVAARRGAGASPRGRRGPASGCPSGRRRACSARAASSASRPSAASPTTSMSGLGSRIMRKPRGRAPGRRRSGRGCSCGGVLSRGSRAADAKPPPSPRAGLERRRRTAPRARACRRARGRPSPSPFGRAVVRDLELDLVRAVADDDPRHARGPACLSAFVSASWTIR